jgi:hypothetical protein
VLVLVLVLVRCCLQKRRVNLIRKRLPGIAPAWRVEDDHKALRSPDFAR